MAVTAKPPSGAGKPDFRTISGEPVRELYTAEDLPAGIGGPEDPIGRPGAYPFTRGIHESMYRGRLWTMRQFAGFGTSEETNERFRYLLDHGQTGLSTAFDMPSLMGHDSDHARSLGEVGREGVAIDTLDDMQTLFQGIDLGEVSVSMTINAPAAIMLAFYVAAAESDPAHPTPPERLSGTIQADILKEYIAQKEWCFPIDPAMRLCGDMIEWCTLRMPRWHPISISGYHIREAGSTAQQELAFTLKDGLTYVEQAVEPASRMWYPLIDTGCQRGIVVEHHSIMSPSRRIAGSIGKHHSFCAMYSLRMSAWIVPASRSAGTPCCSAATT